jgi:hypothetical protein
MKNYGEEIAYWYFRFNGFIPMSNFVLHRRGRVHSSDCDLIAIRFPNPWEEIGGQEHDYDGPLLKALGCDDKRTIVTFVQAKAGGYVIRDVEEYFSRHLEYLVERVGLLPRADVAKFVSEFDPLPRHETQTCVFSKVALLRPDGRPQEVPWITCDFDHAIGFIQGRLQHYAEKRRDRMFFPDSLIQFLADQAHFVRQPRLFPDGQ